MQPKISKILVYFMLALLAAFLSFWIHEEYKSEQQAVQNEYDLKIAKEIFGMNGIDLSSILTKVRGSTEEVAIQIDVTSESNNQIIDGRVDTTKEVHSRMQIKHAAVLPDSILFSKDSIRITKSFYHNGVLDEEDSDVSIISSNDFPDSNQLAPESPLRKIITQGHQMSNEEISRKALQNIWPQILFAIFLFSLLTFGIYLLQKSYKEQQVLLENKNNLISNITHELKTPVATIGVALEAIQDFNIKDNPDKANSYINLSRKELNRLSTSIDQVLQLSKMDSKSESYQFEKQTIIPLCTEVAQHLELQLQQKNIQLQVSNKHSEWKTSLDVSHFKSMLFNLIDNSLKYGKTGGYINIDLQTVQNSMELKISDNGIGIDPKYLSKLFERFFRVPHGDQHNVKGYGLGLSYVKEIIDAHGWHIKIDSKLDIGTTVTIQIPNSNV